MCVCVREKRESKGVNEREQAKWQQQQQLRSSLARHPLRQEEEEKEEEHQAVVVVVVAVVCCLAALEDCHDGTLVLIPSHIKCGLPLLHH